MFCGTCGHEIDATLRYCTQCGTDLSLQASSPRPPGGVPIDPIESAPTLSSGPLHPGDMLSERYRLVSELGIGGMGHVWRAVDTQLNDMPIALKVLPAVLSLHPASIEALRREAAISLRLTHTSICRVYTFHFDGLRAFLTMEHVEGRTLDQLLDSRPGRKLPLDELLTIAGPLADAIDFAHKQEPPVLHRDIKPANVMVGADGRPKLVDFGIAREISDSMTRITGQQTGGTLLYMSPEQLDGKEGAVASDIYSFAAVLYECLAGRPPFIRGDIADQLRHKRPDNIPDVPAHVNRAIFAALAKKPERRPATARALVAALAAPLSDWSLNPWWAAAACVAACVIIGIARRNHLAPPQAQHVATTPAATTSMTDGEPEVQPSSIPASAPAARLSLDLGDGVALRLVQLPECRFIMGSPDEEDGRDADEPRHVVIISRPYQMAAMETAVAQFRQFIRATDRVTDAEREGWAYTWDGKEATKGANTSWRSCGFDQPDNHPVVCVSWNDAIAFCKWAGEHTGRTVRLPTEAEWEYACRAGSSTRYPWGDDPAGGKGFVNCADLNYQEATQWPQVFNWRDGFVHTAPVGSFRANDFGLHDMIGNVWQWCSDWYDAYPDDAAVDPTGPRNGTTRVLRGGGWASSPHTSRAANRISNPPDFRGNYVGFRVVVECP